MLEAPIPGRPRLTPKTKCLRKIKATEDLIAKLEKTTPPEGEVWRERMVLWHTRRLLALREELQRYPRD